ncbi:hypothetical protein VNI00_014239 [Paramarasmius palmivorus]|uniref:Uncharacterized protein n=1 Tax=Paramarasmius palmivorus TaxID=297713 RepID=A0AAW0BTZ1_9AGAR
MPAGNVENLEIQVHGSHGNTTSRIDNLADDTLVPSCANQGGSGPQVLDEDSPALLPDNGNLARALADSTNLQDSDIQVAVSQSVAEGVSVPLSAGNNDNGPTVPKEAKPLDIDPDHLAQATEDVAQAISLPFEEHGEAAGADHRGQGIVAAGGIASGDSGQDIHTVSDGISLAILEPPGRVTGIRSSRSGDSVGGDGVSGLSGRVGWNPTNDPNSLRVHWFRP